MRDSFVKRLAVVLLFAALAAVPIRSAQAETLVGTNVDSRLLAGFEVNPDGVEAFLPDGWTPIAFPDGPLAGANLLVVLIDRAVQLDAEGKPTSPPNSRYAALVGLGKQEGGDAVRLYVYRIYASDLGPNPYGNSIIAEVGRATSTEGPADMGRQHGDAWTVAPDGSGELALSLTYTTGARSWAPGEARPFSNTMPDFSRIYRYEQLVDLVMSRPLGKELTGTFSFSSSIPELADIFDGSEEAVGILDVPVYVRKVYLP